MIHYLNKVWFLMIATTTNKRKKWLRRAGLITGIAGMIEIFVYGFFAVEGGPGWGSLIPAFALTVVFSIPLIACLVISRTRPFIGGMILIGVAAVMLIGAIVTFFGRPIVNPVAERWMYFGIAFSLRVLPFLIPGILITLSSERSGNKRQPTT